jgi:type VI secretion system secreted protein VgrG
MGQLRQFKRLFHLETPLGEDALLVKSLQGRESMSDQFHFTADLISEDANLDARELIGKRVNLGIRLADERTFRYFNGFVSRALDLPPENRVAAFRVEIVPWAWFLTQTTDCYIHQNKTVPDVVKWAFQKNGFQDFQDDCRNTGNYTPWEYLTQYRETTFAFVNRLLEIEGIFYFWKQENGKHTLVMGDSPAAHQPCPYQARYKLEHVFGGGYLRQEDVILSWEVKRRFKSGKWAHRDYYFETPDADLHAETPTRQARAGNDKYELYDYPGEYEQHGDGQTWSRHRMESVECNEEEIRGTSTARSMIPGFKFDLTGHERRDQNRTYLLTEVVHQGTEASFFPDDAPTKPRYTNSFLCIPIETPYRPTRRTPKHIMRGVQTALVVGPKGEEIYCDKYGRVKVQFYWDRVGKKDEGSSCWIRVSQPWAGKNFGSMFLPRIGQEVIVDFVEGDPDRPIITGRVYNSNNMPPWKLPGKQNYSGHMSRSTKGGGNDNYNEIRFDDTKGKEVLVIHAERDLEISVENDTIIETEKKHDETIGDKRTLTVASDERINIGGNREEEIKGDEKHYVGGSGEYKVGSNMTINAGGTLSISATKIVLEAPMGIVMKGGSGSVQVNTMGVSIEGPMVKINCGTPATDRASTITKKPVDKAKKPERWKDKG